MECVGKRTDRGLDLQQLLAALDAFSKGDTSVRIDSVGDGLATKVADAVNDLLDRQEHLDQRARDADRRKDEFLAVLGHELRSPLAAIINAGELTKLLDRSEPFFDEVLGIIRRQASLMAQFVDDLLDVSRITNGRVKLLKTDVHVSQTLARVAKSTAPLFSERGHTLHLSVPKPDIVFQADPCRLEQILTNLLVNAAKYTDTGGKVWLSVVRTGREVEFRVRDSGIGISADVLPNVFDLFSQHHSAPHRADRSGLGIGLKIVRGLTELHGGRASASSGGLGRGAEFVVALPAMSDAHVPALSCNP